MAVTNTTASGAGHHDHHGLSEDALDRLRHQADPSADNAVGAYFWGLESIERTDLFAALAAHTRLPSEAQDAAIRNFLDDAAALPTWADPDRVRRGQEFFNDFAAHHMGAVYLAALPMAYAAAKAVQVLHVIASLRTDTERRVNETAQLLMDVSRPDALGPGGVGVERILHVRLMHAAVRWLIGNDPAITHVSDAPPAEEPSPQGPSDVTWSASWGRPVNQEDLLWTFLTFTTVIYDAFDALGVDITDEQVTDHLHIWRLIAHWMGIDPAVVPLDRDSASALQRRIAARQHAPSAAGRAMTTSLLAQIDRRLPGAVAAKVPSTMRRLNGDVVCDFVGVPGASRTRARIEEAARRTIGAGHRPPAGLRRWTARLGRSMTAELSDVARRGERPSFEVPEHLTDTLGRR